MHHSPCPFPRRAAFLNSGPFPPPELPGFPGTTSLSATLSGPACPSRASGWDLASLRIGLLVLQQFPMCRHAVTITPVGSLDRIVRNEGVSAPRISPATAAFPGKQAGRLPHRDFRGLLGVHSRYGLTTRRTAKTVRFSRRLRRLSYLHRRSDSFRLERLNLAGWDLHPLGNCALSRRTAYKDVSMSPMQ